MTSKSRAKSSTLKKDFDYTLHKYSDLQKTWIIYQGHLNYRAVQIKLLNLSQFAMYYVVLAKIPVDDQRDVMGIYLYRNQKHKPSNFFQLNEYDRISDHCSKPIKCSYYLFELIGRDSSDIEIFGASDTNDRQKWIEHIHQALIWTKENYLPNDLPIVPMGPKRSWKEDSKTTEQIDDADVRSNYEPFAERNASPAIANNNETLDVEDQRPMLSAPTVPLGLPRRPTPPIPAKKPTNSEQTTDNIYLTAMEISSSLNNDGDDSSKYQEIPYEDKPFTWKDIFYPNEPDDHSRVLNNISQLGAFLIRPQSQQNNSDNHDYTLSIYAFGGIIKYKMLKTWGKYSLVNDMSEPSFDTIAELCQYYTKHHLPRSSSRGDDLSKGSVTNFCLKWPYTYYLNHSDRF